MAKKFKAVIIGEVSHFNRALQREAARSLSELKKAGFRHVGLEMLPRDIDVKNSDKMLHHTGEYYDGHAVVIQEALRLNMTILPLDMPYDKQSTYQDEDTLYTARNQWMANAAIKEINNGSKIVLYMHYGHSINGTASHNIPDANGIKYMLSNAGIPTLNIQLMGGPLTNLANEQCTPKRRLSTSVLAQRDGVQNKLFSVPGNQGVDHIVHLPQNCTL